MPTRRKMARVWAFAWTFLILVACWTPGRYLHGPESEEGSGFEVPHLDKLIHGTLFAVFGFLWMHAGAIDGRRAASVLVAGLVLAALTEAGQALPIVDRDAGLGDGAADAVGLLLAVGGVWAWERRRRPEPVEPS
jgi:VanZ family protein